MLPDEVLTRFYREKVNRQEKITFFSSLVFGFASHLFMLVNKLPNYDDIHCLLDDYGSGIEVGRWMLFILGNIVRKTHWECKYPLAKWVDLYHYIEYNGCGHSSYTGV